jgi:hypothetical protein
VEGRAEVLDIEHRRGVRNLLAHRVERSPQYPRYPDVGAQSRRREG